MSLQEKLNEFKNNFESGNPPFNVSPDVVATIHKATDELRSSGILDRVLKKGDKAPEFSLPNENGEIIHYTNKYRNILNGYKIYDRTQNFFVAKTS